MLACALADELTAAQAERLLQECRRDPGLLEELTRLAITERLLAYAHLYGRDESAFVREVRERLGASRQSPRSAGFQPAVSPTSSRPGSRTLPGSEVKGAPADWKSAIRQVGNLRYGGGAGMHRERLQAAEAPPGNVLRLCLWRQPVWKWAAAAALLCLLGSLGVAWWLKGQAGASALVVRTEAVSVPPGQPALLPGHDLPAGRLELQTGLVELQFKSGANLIIEGPAAFEVVGPLRCVLYQGQAVAQVPEAARGFTVDGPRGRLVDLGTEFGVRVSPSGDTEVHVLKGRVEAIRNGQRRAVELTENQALRLTAQTNLNLPADATAFVTDMPPGAKGPIGYVHWSFDEGQGAIASDTGQGLGLTNASAHLCSFAHPGPGPQWSQGQFGTGLCLNGSGDYVECDFPGIGGRQPRTVAFWVKVPQDIALDQSDAIINWGTDARPGAVWRVSVNNAPDANHVWGGPLGRLRVGVHGGYVVGTTDLRDGRWHHCAVVMYGGRRPQTGSHVLIYIDGQLEPAARKQVFEISTDVQHASAHNVWIGRNLSYREAGQKVLGGAPFFKGCVDEVFIFNAALSQEQILSLMKYNHLEASAPPPPAG